MQHSGNEHELTDRASNQRDKMELDIGHTYIKK